MIRFGDSEIILLAQQIWQPMLSLPLHPVEPNTRTQWSTDSLSPKECFAACVQIAGAWTGAVRLDCSEAFARQTAAAFLGIAAVDVAREQMLDALGEVTNMMAGSIKPLLPKPCHISLPSIVDGADYELNIRKGRLVLTSEFESQGDRMKLSLLEALVTE
jgi:chemotaxis protein CheX